MTLRRLVATVMVLGGLLVAARPAGADLVLLPPPEPAPLSSFERIALYEQQKKVPLQALAWELIPGAGSLYADDLRGAVVTWALTAVGLGATLWGMSEFSPVDPIDPNDRGKGSAAAMPAVLGGLALGIGGRIFGFANAVNASDRQNAALRARLGLPSESSDAR